MNDEVTIEYERYEDVIVKRDRSTRKLYNVYVLFHDDDAEPLGVENVLDFEDRSNVFFMVDASGNRWFIPHEAYRWIEVTPMEES